MEYKKVNGMKMPAIGLGTWKMGGNIMADHSKDEMYIESIRRAIKLGLTHIDTAEIYSAGHSEELVGKAIADFNRKDLFITTKISPHHLLTQKQIINCAKNSMKRLNIDYIDLYLVHWPPFLFSSIIKNTMSTFDKLVSNDLIRFIGVSNFSVDQMKIAQKFSRNKIITNQVEYNLLNKEPEHELLDFCNDQDIILTAYSPLAKGAIKNGSHKLIDDIADKYKKTAVQTAIRYLLDKPNVITIPKITSNEHLKEIIGALNWHLKKEDSDLLGRSF